jgi:hypothetical protein
MSDSATRLQPRPGRRAVDGGDDGNAAADHAEHEVAAVPDGRGAQYRIAAEFRQVGQVAAGRERAARPGQHGAPGLVVLAEPRPQPGEAGVQRVVDRVQAHGAIQCDDPQRAVRLNLDLVRHVIHISHIIKLSIR